MSKQIPPIRVFMTMVPVTIGQHQSLRTADNLMAEHGIRHLPVVDDEGAVAGVLSARELKTLMRVCNTDPSRVNVGAVISRDLFHTSPDAPLDAVCATMAEHRYGCAVILQDKKVLGIFTNTDACAALATLIRDRAEC